VADPQHSSKEERFVLLGLSSRYAAGSGVVVLEPDVAAAFPSSGEANEALRALAGIAATVTGLNLSRQAAITTLLSRALKMECSGRPRPSREAE